MATKIIVKGCYTEAWAGCSSPYPRPWSSHGVMAGATPDLRLPSQPKSTATSHWPVLISCTAKGIGDLLEWLITHQDGVPIFFRRQKLLGQWEVSIWVGARPAWPPLDYIWEQSDECNTISSPVNRICFMSIQKRARLHVEFRNNKQSSKVGSRGAGLSCYSRDAVWCVGSTSFSLTIRRIIILSRQHLMDSER